MSSSRNLSNTRREIRLAKAIWPALDRTSLGCLSTLLRVHGLSVSNGDVSLICGRWYVTNSGLLRVAVRKGCQGIQVRPVKEFCDSKASHYVFRAVVLTSSKCKGFIGYGDANPFNVSELVRGAELRIAETRAVNRALRKAYGIGICSVEELGSSTSVSPSVNTKKMRPKSSNINAGGYYGGPKLRDRLCQLIHLHQLDANLVKSYAVEFCGTKTLREATREQVEAFVVHLSDWAERDRDALLCQLNSYLPSPKEVSQASERAGAA